jgi:hypothetical protein
MLDVLPHFGLHIQLHAQNWLPPEAGSPRRGDLRRGDLRRGDLRRPAARQPCCAATWRLVPDGLVAAEVDGAVRAELPQLVLGVDVADRAGPGPHHQ